LVKQQIGERDLFEYYANIGQISDSEEHFLEDKKIKLFTVILAIMCLDSSGNTDMSSERDSSLYSKAARMSPVYLYCENATNLHISSIF